MNIKNGFLIFATGHPYYGRMAHNLAFSIKAIEPETEIAVAHAGNALNHLDDHNREVFDHIIPMEPDVPVGPQAKLYGSWYTPFENTIVVDCDTLWLPRKKPSDLFKELDGNLFTAITEGNEADPHARYPFWADIPEIKAHYHLKEQLYQWRSEVMYFNQDGGAILDRAREILLQGKLKSAKLFGSAPADELGINVAAAEAGLRPHLYKWNPSYWQGLRGGQVPLLKDLADEYYLVSFGSNGVSGPLKALHNQIMQFASMKLKRPYLFPITAKKSWNPERAKI